MGTSGRETSRHVPSPVDAVLHQLHDEHLVGHAAVMHEHLGGRRVLAARVVADVPAVNVRLGQAPAAHVRRA